MVELSGGAGSRRRTRLAVDLSILAVIGVLLVSAFGAAAAVLYREFYSPSAFVTRYLTMLQAGRAADALAMPGVALDRAELEAVGLPPTASDALLRSAALGSLTDATVVDEHVDGDVTVVTVSYLAGGYSGTTRFRVAPDGVIGVAPTWRFAQSPLAVMNLTVLGSMTFEVNSFVLDKRQVSPDGVDADPVAPLSMLVFSPGLYAISVDSPMATSAGVQVLSDAPMVNVPVQVQAQPTEEFVAVVQERVEEFLLGCTTQQVLQPTGCPFGYVVRNRVEELPTWSIVTQPQVTIVPDGAGWRIPDAQATAHIELEIRSIFDGTLRTVSEDVPFLLNGTITVMPDGKASIQLGGTDAPS